MSLHIICVLTTPKFIPPVQNASDFQTYKSNYYTSLHKNLQTWSWPSLPNLLPSALSSLLMTTGSSSLWVQSGNKGPDHRKTCEDVSFLWVRWEVIGGFWTKNEMIRLIFFQGSFWLFCWEQTVGARGYNWGDHLGGCCNNPGVRAWWLGSV